MQLVVGYLRVKLHITPQLMLPYAKCVATFCTGVEGVEERLLGLLLLKQDEFNGLNTHAIFACPVFKTVLCAQV